MKLIHNIPDIENKLKSKIASIFDKKSLNLNAYKTKFIQRVTCRLQGEDFIQLMTSASIEPKIAPLEGLCERLREINPNADIAPQSLMDRINRIEAVNYLKSIFEKTLSAGLELISDKIPVPLLAHFENVYIEDSTECLLNKALNKCFKGPGGTVEKATVKINLIYEIHQRAIKQIDFGDRTTPDQKLSKKILEFIKKGDLIIRDLGYFCFASLKIINKIGAYFLSRLPAHVNIYLNKEDKIPLDITKYLNTYHKCKGMIELNVYITIKKEPVRLIVYRVPEEIAVTRRRKANRGAKRRGITLSESARNKLDFNFFITNVPEAIWRPEIVGTVYTIRWKIELIFKEWKSGLSIHYMKGTCEYRVWCLIYSKLITIIVVHMIHSVIDWYSEIIKKQEISLHKLLNWLLRKSRLSEIMIEGLKEALMKELKEEVKRGKRGCLLKQKRVRKTTYEHLRDETPYWEVYKSKISN